MTLVRFIFALFFLISAAPVSAEVTIPTSDGSRVFYKNSLALVVGITKYDSKEWPPLNSIASETDELERVLQSQGFSVSKHVGRISSGQLARILKQFLAQKPGRETRMLVFFAGHGWSDAQTSVGYIVPSDAPETQDAAFLSYLTSMEEIKALSLQSDAKHILFVFDSCFSGSVFNTRSAASSPPQLTIDQMDTPSRQFITAGSANQTVPAVSSFAPAFIAGIAGSADLIDDDVVTADELGMWLHSEVSKNDLQTPQWGRVSDTKFKFGEFLFVPTSTVPKRIDPPLNNSNQDEILSERGVGPDQNVRNSVYSVTDDSKFADIFQRVEIDVLYFARRADKGRVEALLRDLGVGYRSQTSSKSDMSNVVTCTEDIPFNAVQWLTIRLIESGLPIRNIAPQYHRNSVKKVTIENLDFADEAALLTPEVVLNIDHCPSFEEVYAPEDTVVVKPEAIFD